MAKSLLEYARSGSDTVDAMAARSLIDMNPGALRGARSIPLCLDSVARALVAEKVQLGEWLEFVARFVPDLSRLQYGTWFHLLIRRPSLFYASARELEMPEPMVRRLFQDMLKGPCFGSGFGCAKLPGVTADFLGEDEESAFRVFVNRAVKGKFVPDDVDVSQGVEMGSWAKLKALYELIPDAGIPATRFGVPVMHAVLQANFLCTDAIGAVACHVATHSPDRFKNKVYDGLTALGYAESKKLPIADYMRTNGWR